MRMIGVYVPDWLPSACVDLGYKSFGEAFYKLISDRILQDDGDNPYKDLVKKQEALPQEVRIKAGAKETGPTPESQAAALDEYLRSLLPAQVQTLRLAVWQGNMEKLRNYQDQIEQRYRVWINPTVFYNRLGPGPEPEPEKEASP